MAEAEQNEISVEIEPLLAEMPPSHSHSRSHSHNDQQLEGQMCPSYTEGNVDSGGKISPPLSPGPASPVKEWLTELKMDEYADRLASQGFDSLATIRTVTDADLEEFGVLRGHRRYLLERIQREIVSSRNIVVDIPESAENIGGNDLKSVARARRGNAPKRAETERSEPKKAENERNEPKNAENWRNERRNPVHVEPMEIPAPARHREENGYFGSLQCLKGVPMDSEFVRFCVVAAVGTAWQWLNIVAAYMFAFAYPWTPDQINANTHRAVIGCLFLYPLVCLVMIHWSRKMSVLMVAQYLGLTKWLMFSSRFQRWIKGSYSVEFLNWNFRQPPAELYRYAQLARGVAPTLALIQIPQWLIPLLTEGAMSTRIGVLTVVVSGVSLLVSLARAPENCRFSPEQTWSRHYP